MTWASRKTTEMPTVPALPPGRHRRRRRSAGAALVLALLALTVAGAVYFPTLLGWPGGDLASGPGSAEPGSAGPGSTVPATTGAGSTVADAGRQPDPTPTSSPSATASPATTARSAAERAGLASYEDEVLAITNGERAKKEDCPNLRMDARLRTAARRHSDEMARDRTMRHNGRDGSDPDERMRAAGYSTQDGWAENVARGYRTPALVMRGWMGSDGHRANIMNCSYRAIGVGVARGGDGKLYWTQDFGGH